MAKARRSAAQKAATKRMLAVNREARAAAGETAPRRRPKKRSAKRSAAKTTRKRTPKRSSARSIARVGTISSVRELKLLRPGANAKQDARLKALEHNQNVIVQGIVKLGTVVQQHHKALVAKGILTRRGSA